MDIPGMLAMQMGGMIKIFKLVFWILLLAIGLQACGSSASDSSSEEETESTDEELTASFTSIQDNIFTPSCALAGCHSSASAQVGMSLAEGEAYDNIVGVESTEAAGLNRIEAFDPDNSYLIHKLEGTQESVGGSGARMPKNSSALTDEQIAILREWITNGATEN